jgi:hypothetical protein
MESDKLNQGNGGPNEIVDEENPDGANQKDVDDSTCWDSFTEGMKICIKTTYLGLAMVTNFVKKICGFVYYPIKERCANCSRKIDLYMNPYRDATIHDI